MSWNNLAPKIRWLYHAENAISKTILRIGQKKHHAMFIPRRVFKYSQCWPRNIGFERPCQHIYPQKPEKERHFDLLCGSGQFALSPLSTRNRYRQFPTCADWFCYSEQKDATYAAVTTQSPPRFKIERWTWIKSTTSHCCAYSIEISSGDTLGPAWITLPCTDPETVPANWPGSSTELDRSSLAPNIPHARKLPRCIS